MTIGISDHTTALHNPKGIDVMSAWRHAQQNRNMLEGFDTGHKIEGDELLELDVDVLIPAAVGGVIHEDNVSRIQAPIIIEAANAPIEPEADELLEERGVTVLPDILANAGGVTVSYFEWVQNRQHYRWHLDRVRGELDRTLLHAFDDVWDRAKERELGLRTTAFMVGVEKVARATELAGLG